MTERRATDHERAATVRPTTSYRVRSIAVAVALLSLGVCGAVAQASSGDDDGNDSKANGVAGGKVAAAAASSTTVASSSSEVGDGDALPPDGLGDDSELNALAEACFGDDLVACDLLFLRSPIGSPYEEYGDTCAGRQEAGTENYCGLASREGSAGNQPIPPDGLGDDAALDALAQSCYAGEMAACDELYGSAETGSPYQVYGDTCAGRQPENTGRYCTALEDPVVPGTGDGPTTEEDGGTSLPPGTEPASTPPSSDTSVPAEPGEIPPPTIEPTGLGDDPALDELAQSCYDGELAACDDLFQASDPDTAYRQYGDTCAGRQPEGTGRWCVDAFEAQAPTTDSAPSTSPPTVDTVEPATSVAATEPATTVAPATSAAPATTIDAVPPDDTSPTEPVPIPPPTIEPTDLGDDPMLDELAQSCYDGDLAACDDLWREAEIDSAYRDYGDTCAGRQEPGTGIWCVDAFVVPGSTEPATSEPASTVPPDTVPATQPPGTPGLPPATEQPTGLGDDPALDALAQSCYDGDMQACDDLFDRAPLGSEYRVYGDTCAGRQEAGTFNYCGVVFPAGTRLP